METPKPELYEVRNIKAQYSAAILSLPDVVGIGIGADTMDNSPILKIYMLQLNKETMHKITTLIPKPFTCSFVETGAPFAAQAGK